jgi:hypothetical protein
MKRIMLVLLAVSTTASAQIGRTLKQCEVSYGKPRKQEQESDGTKCFFEHPDKDLLGRDYLIIAKFSDGVCNSIMYSRKDSDPIITQHQVEILLRENANGYIWTLTRTSAKEIDYSAHLEGIVFQEAFCAPWKWVWILTEQAARNLPG